MKFSPLTAFGLNLSKCSCPGKIDITITSISKFFYYCHIDIDFTKNYILTNFNPKSVSAENFIAIEQGKNHFYSD